MNNITYDRLKRCTRANLGQFDKSTKSIFIPKYKEIKIEEKRCYLIKLNSTITNPSGNSVLAINWNQGRIPKNQYYKVQVLKTMASMINVMGAAYDYENQKDLDEVWTGWLPITEIKIVKEL